MEAEDISIDLSKLCRTCNSECLHMSPLYTQDPETGHRLDDMLMNCTNLKILDSIGFPNSICDHCVEELQSAYRFKQQCVIVDRYYRRLSLKTISNSTQTPTFRLQNHKKMYSKNEIIEGKQKSLRVRDGIVFMGGENEELNFELKQEKDRGEDDLSNLFTENLNKKVTKGISEEVVIPMESKEQRAQDGEIKEDLLEVMKEIDVIHDNINSFSESSSSDDGDPTYFPSDLDYSPNKKKIRNCRKIKRKSLKTNRSRILRCADCTQEFDKPEELKAHSVIHACRVYVERLTGFDSPTNEPRRFKCGVCEKSFKHSSKLRCHMQSHATNKYFFKCDVCGRTFKRLAGLWVHERRMHDSNCTNRRFKCGTCGKPFYYQFQLRRHERGRCEENKLESFKCVVCEKLFKCFRYLRTHQRKFHSANMQSQIR